MVFRELSIDEFIEFSRNYKESTLYQTYNYALFMNNEGYKYYILGLVDYSSIKAATLVFTKSNSLKYGYIPDGFLIDYNDYALVSFFTKELKKFLSKKDMVAVKFNPKVLKNIYNSKYQLSSSVNDYEQLINVFKQNNCNHLGFNKYFESLLPRYEAIVSLTNDKYNDFFKMSKQFRTKARSAETRGVRIYKGSLDDLEEIYNSLNIKKHSISWYKNIIESFKDDAILFYAKLDTSAYLKLCQSNYLSQEKLNNAINDKVFSNKGKSHEKLLDKKMYADVKLGDYHQFLDEAIKLHSNSKDGIFLGLCIAVLHNDSVNIIDLSYNKEFTRFNGSHLLLWKILEKYSESNYKVLNLGGLTINEKDNKYSGLNKFKLGFGSSVYEYIGDFELVCNYPKYLLYRNGLSLFK